MFEHEDNAKAFATFRVLNGDASSMERDQLFRNMAQLFSYVSDRCDDEQVAQYDDVLCQLADLVEEGARAHVARVLAPLDRAPGTVVVRLARDSIEVARPLLEFSKVLSDDDLIEIAGAYSEEHRGAIAGRPELGERVGDALVLNGNSQTVAKLVRNKGARLGTRALEQIVLMADHDAEIAADLRGRHDIDWTKILSEIGADSSSVARKLSLVTGSLSGSTVGHAHALAYKRLRNRAGFSAQEWKIAWNQVKALNDRRQLDERSVVRFARFGYGHHVAASLTALLKVPSDVFVKWLALQDSVAMTVALKTLDFSSDMLPVIFKVLPWRDVPSAADLEVAANRFEAISAEEADEIFQTWRAHAFRKRPTAVAH